MSYDLARRGRGMPMCGVFGFAGVDHDVESTVGNALRSLEYRGYDSWGVTWNSNGELTTRKNTGRLASGTLPHARATAAIGHTRWATHGAVTEENAHPHCGCSGRLAVVHNGIIENASALRSGLATRHLLRSTTDSEVVPHLIEDELVNGTDISAAITNVFSRLEGRNAIVVLDSESGDIHAITNGSPLLVAEGDLGSYIGSDVIAFNQLASNMTPIPDLTLTRLGAQGIEMRHQCSATWERPALAAVTARSDDSLGLFDHFMQKEIAEQPDVIERVLNDRESTVALAQAISGANLVVLTGCGSAYFAARFGASWISRTGVTPAMAIPASEFHEVVPFISEHSLVIALSQSGETADVIDALDMALDSHARIQAIVNVPYSTVARKVERAYPLHAGTEQSVLATKSFLAKLTRLYLAAGEVSDRRNDVEQSIRYVMTTLRGQMDDPVFASQLCTISHRLAEREHAFLIGRGTGFACAQEGALKLKESSYIHAEALAAGELKHGTIALIERGTPCLIFHDDSGSPARLSSASQELRSRGAYTIGIGMPAGDEYDEVIALPRLGEAASFIQIHIAQQIAYRAALVRGVNPDRPRNLAKSVTVR